MTSAKFSGFLTPSLPCQNWSYFLIPPLYRRHHIWTQPPPLQNCIVKSRNQYQFELRIFPGWDNKAVVQWMLVYKSEHFDTWRWHIYKDGDVFLVSKYDVRIPLHPPPPDHIWSDFKLPPPSPLEQTSFVHAPFHTITSQPGVSYQHKRTCHYRDSFSVFFGKLLNQW